MRSFRIDRTVLLAAVCLTAVSVGVRAPLVITQPLWIDEVASARVVTQPTFGAMLRQVRRTESTPPGWYALAWSTRKVAGSGDIAYLRWLSVLFGVCTTVLTFLFSRRFLGNARAGFAALLVAISPAFVDHGSEIRAYSLLALLTVLFAVTLRRASENAAGSRLIAVGLVAGLGALTHYFFFFALLAGLVWLWSERTDTEVSRLRVTFAIGIGLIPFLAWLPSFAHQYRHKLYGFIEPFSARGLAFSYSRIFGLFGESGILYAAGRVAILLAVLAGTLQLIRTQKRGRDVGRDRAARLSAAFAVVPVVAAAVLWVFGEHIFLERNLIGVGPFAAIAIIAGLSALPGRVGPVACLAVSLAAAWSSFTFERSWGRSPYDSIAAHLVDAGWTQDARLIQFGPFPGGLINPVAWYLPGKPLLTRDAASASCAVPTFVVSYDRYAGPAWLRRHGAKNEKTYPAYDHSPRGPRAVEPIFVSRVGSSPALARNAVAHGGRVYIASGSRACR